MAGFFQSNHIHWGEQSHHMPSEYACQPELQQQKQTQKQPLGRCNVVGSRHRYHPRDDDGDDNDSDSYSHHVDVGASSVQPPIPHKKRQCLVWVTAQRPPPPSVLAPGDDRTTATTPTPTQSEATTTMEDAAPNTTAFDIDSHMKSCRHWWWHSASRSHPIFSTNNNRDKRSNDNFIKVATSLHRMHHHHHSTNSNLQDRGSKMNTTPLNGGSDVVLSSTTRTRSSLRLQQRTMWDVWGGGGSSSTSLSSSSRSATATNTTASNAIATKAVPSSSLLRVEEYDKIHNRCCFVCQRTGRRRPIRHGTPKKMKYNHHNDATYDVELHEETDTFELKEDESNHDNNSHEIYRQHHSRAFPVLEDNNVQDGLCYGDGPGGTLIPFRPQHTQLDHNLPSSQLSTRNYQEEQPRRLVQRSIWEFDVRRHHHHHHCNEQHEQHVEDNDVDDDMEQPMESFTPGENEERIDDSCHQQKADHIVDDDWMSLSLSSSSWVLAPCHFCDHRACSTCLHVCAVCCYTYCTFCSTTDLTTGREARMLCLDCAAYAAAAAPAVVVFSGEF